MKAKTVKYYDWFKDIQPELLKNIIATLASQGIAPPPSGFRGGYFKDGQWVDVGQGEYRDYWHVFIEVWGERINNDSYVLIYFPDYDSDSWDELRYNLVQKKGIWSTVVVDAVYKMLVDNKLYDKDGTADVLIWFSW